MVVRLWAAFLLAATIAQASEPQDWVAIAGIDTIFQVMADGDHGPSVQKGDYVECHATGIVMESNKKFWSTKDPGQQPFSFSAGVGQVIKGWDRGVLGMQKGEKRRLKIPAAEGYGANGFPAWGIPAGATLIFEIEILKISLGQGKGPKIKDVKTEL